MITHAVLVPHPPLLVPELSPGPVDELGSLREACLTAVRRLGDRWIAVGAHTHDLVIEPGAAGTFRGYGVDVPVRLSDGQHAEALPLPALVAGWLREQAGAASVRVHLVDETTDPAGCERIGKRLAEADETGLLVLGDGSNRHGPRAPGSEDGRAPGFDETVAEALATANTEALLALDPRLADELGAGGRVPWQVLAGLGAGWRAELLYSAAPFGVSYHVAVWERQSQGDLAALGVTTERARAEGNAIVAVGRSTGRNGGSNDSSALATRSRERAEPRKTQERA